MLIQANPGIRNLSAYQLADLSVAAGRRLISLAQNELYFGPTEKVMESAARAVADSNHYPDPQWSELTTAIANLHNIKQTQILCGAGSMELLELLGRIYLSSNDSIVMSEFSYSFFKTVAQMYCAKIEIAREINFSVNIDLILEKVKSDTKIVFIANPGNPTGTLLPVTEIRRLRHELPEQILLIIDEAYAEFTDSKDYSTLFDLVDCNNTVVLRTFSKIYGLAGMRVGWGYFPTDIYSHMRKVLNPNNISAVSQVCAATAVQDQFEIQKRRQQIKLTKTEFCTQLDAMGYNMPDSHSNFVLIDFGNNQIASAAYETLKNHGVILRPMNAYGLFHCLRATISNPQDMTITTQILKKFTEELSR